MTLWQWLSLPMTAQWSRIEAAWTIGALLGLILATVKLWVVVGDLVAVWQLRRMKPSKYASDRVLGAWWVVANAVKDELMLLAFVLIGWVAGQLPAQPVVVSGEQVPASVISGFALIAVELVTVGVVGFTLWARLKLSERTPLAGRVKGDK